MLRTIAPFASDLWLNRSLLWQFSVRQVELRHKGSHLGLIWSFLNPLLLLGLYVFVFGYIFSGTFGTPNETRTEYALGVFLGLTLFHFFAEVLGISPMIVVANPNFVKKVVFPLEVLPAANVAAAGIHMGITLLLVLAGLLLFGPGLAIQTLWLPVVILPVLLFGLGICWLFSALGVFLRDTNQVMQFLTQALMFASAVFYPASRIPPHAWTILRWNPLLLSIEMARDVALWQRNPNMHHLAYIYVVGILCCVGGHWAFRRMKPAFADVL